MSRASTIGAGPTPRVAVIAPLSTVPSGQRQGAGAARAGGPADGGDPGLRRARPWRRRCRPPPRRPRPARPRRAAPGRRCRGVAGPGDGDVEHVDPVGHRRVDGRDHVGARAAVVIGVGRGPARLVDRHPRLGRGTREGAVVLVAVEGVDAGVAGRQRRELGAVAVVVVRRGVGAGAQVAGPESGDEVAGRRRSCRCSRRGPTGRPVRTAPRKSRGRGPSPER